MDRKAWQAPVHGVTELDTTEQPTSTLYSVVILTFYFQALFLCLSISQQETNKQTSFL